MRPDPDASCGGSRKANSGANKLSAQLRKLSVSFNLWIMATLRAAISTMRGGFGGVMRRVVGDETQSEARAKREGLPEVSGGSRYL